jgi:hypothetical protein
VHPVPRHDLYACELPIGGSSSTVAVAMRQEHQPRRGVGRLSQRRKCGSRYIVALIGG